MKKIVLILLACTLLVGCGVETEITSQRNEPGDGQITIGMMPKLIGIDYFNACEQGAQEAAQELGVNLVYDGPTVDDVSKQAEMIDSWIIRKFNAISIAPNDMVAIGSTLQKAKDRGVRVITWDAEGENREYHVNMAKSQAIAHTLVDVMAEALGGGGEYAIITGRLTTANQNAWIAHMRNYIAQEFPNLSEVDLKTSEENQQLAYQVTGDLLKTYPNLKGIFAITSVALPGAAQAIEEAKAQDRVFLTGLSSPNSMRQYIKRGVVKKFVLWSPVDLGYLTIHTANRLVKGEPVEGGFEAGRLGHVDVEGTEVILGNPVIFDAGNIDQYNF